MDQNEKKNQENNDIMSFKVEKIVGERIKNGKIQYLVKWKGLPKKFNTWEDRESIKSQENSQKIQNWKKSENCDSEPEESLLINKKIIIKRVKPTELVVLVDGNKKTEEDEKESNKTQRKNHKLSGPKIFQEYQNYKNDKDKPTIINGFINNNTKYYVLMDSKGNKTNISAEVAEENYPNQLLDFLEGLI